MLNLDQKKKRIKLCAYEGKDNFEEGEWSKGFCSIGELTKN
jgi:hypothetical protein